MQVLTQSFQGCNTCPDFPKDHHESAHKIRPRWQREAIVDHYGKSFLLTAYKSEAAFVPRGGWTGPKGRGGRNSRGSGYRGYRE